jgi:predicted amidophosphoribosyltransferase
MNKFCYYCNKRTEHIEDFNSRICKRCGRTTSLGSINLSSGIIKVPRYSDKIKVKRIRL